MEQLEFKAWGKMTRINPLLVTITEKMDGTNACIIIENGEVVGAQSRTKLITEENDNYGFAKWVGRNKEALAGLGDGHHFGEWAGLGIQSNPHNLECKKFFLFNTYRWGQDNQPSVCEVVKVLYEGNLTEELIPKLLVELEQYSKQTGYKAEGIVCYNHAHQSYTKHTIKSPNGKWCK